MFTLPDSSAVPVRKIHHPLDHPTRTRAGRVSAIYLARFLDRYAHRIMVYYNSCFSGMWQGISTYIYTHVPLEYLV